MKNIKILHLFPKLLSLYGEYGNVKIIEKTLSDKGFTVECDALDSFESPFVGFDLYDFIYVGSGTEANIVEASKRLENVKEALKNYISSGKVLLSTGNSPALFGKSIKYRGTSFDALDAFDYRSELFTDKRFIGDSLTDSDNIFGHELIGFVNTSALYEGVTMKALANNILGKTLGNDKKSGGDGFICQSFIASQFIGPLAVKNPHVCAKICEMISGEAFEINKNSNAFIAYERGLSELKKRLNA